MTVKPKNTRHFEFHKWNLYGFDSTWEYLFDVEPDEDNPRLKMAVSIQGVNIRTVNEDGETIRSAFLQWSELDRATQDVDGVTL